MPHSPERRPHAVGAGRLVVAASWAWSYITFQRGTRLISCPDPEPAVPAGPRSA